MEVGSDHQCFARFHSFVPVFNCGAALMDPSAERLVDRGRLDRSYLTGLLQRCGASGNP